MSLPFYLTVWNGIHEIEIYKYFIRHCTGFCGDKVMKNMHKYGSYVQWLQVGTRIVQTLLPLHPLYI